MSKSKRSAVGLGLVLTFGLVLSAVSFRAGAAEKTPPETVTINKIQNFKPPVVFPHNMHKDKLTGKCGNCHVDATGGGALKPEFLTKAPTMGEAMNNAFHKECKGCHTASGNPKAPTNTCGDCHKG